MSSISVRYIADDVPASVAFYVESLGFNLEMDRDGAFAILSSGDFRLMLSRPGVGGAGQAASDGRLPESGGWNRIRIAVGDIEGTVEALRAAGTRFRTGIVEGYGGRQVLVDDPAGNPVELYQSSKP